MELGEFERAVSYDGAIFKDERSYGWLELFGSVPRQERERMLNELREDNG